MTTTLSELQADLAAKSARRAVVLERLAKAKAQLPETKRKRTVLLDRRSKVGDSDELNNLIRLASTALDAAQLNTSEDAEELTLLDAAIRALVEAIALHQKTDAGAVLVDTSELMALHEEQRDLSRKQLDLNRRVVEAADRIQGVARFIDRHDERLMRESRDIPNWISASWLTYYAFEGFEHRLGIRVRPVSGEDVLFEQLVERWRERMERHIKRVLANARKPALTEEQIALSGQVIRNSDGSITINSEKFDKDHPTPARQRVVERELTREELSVFYGSVSDKQTLLSQELAQRVAAGGAVVTTPNHEEE